MESIVGDASTDLELRTAGIVCVLATLEFLIAVHIAQATYPNYSVTQQYLSDLGATCPGGLGTTPCFVVQPAGTIWGAALFTMGALSLLSAYLMHRAVQLRLLPTLLGLWGLGTALAGLFPQSIYAVHGPASALAFVAGALAALMTYRWRLGGPRWFPYVGGALGLTSVAAIAILRIVSFSELNATAIGGGGVERLIVYPIVAWELTLGIVLILGTKRQPEGRSLSSLS